MDTYRGEEAGCGGLIMLTLWPLYSLEKCPLVPTVGRWLGPSVDLNMAVKRILVRNWTPVATPVAGCYTGSGFSGTTDDS
jgi:hypothetical protein